MKKGRRSRATRGTARQEAAAASRGRRVGRGSATAGTTKAGDNKTARRLPRNRRREDDDTQPHGQVDAAQVRARHRDSRGRHPLTRTSSRRACTRGDGVRSRIAAEQHRAVLSRVLRNTWWAPADGRVGRAMGIIFDAPVAYDLAYVIGGARRRRGRLLPDGQARAGTVAAVCLQRAIIARAPSSAKEAHRAGARQRQRRSPHERRTRD